MWRVRGGRRGGWFQDQGRRRGDRARSGGLVVQREGPRDRRGEPSGAGAFRYCDGFRAGQQLGDRLHRVVNEQREREGSVPLPRHPGLDRLAQNHVDFLKANRGKFGLHGRNVSHDGFEARAMIAREKYGIAIVSENVAAGGQGMPKPENVLLEVLLDSASHRHHLMESWQFTGVGVSVADDGMVFAAQMFGTAAIRQKSLTERFRGG